MAGWRVGYVAAPSFVIDCIERINEGVCYNAPSVSQRAALHGLRMRKQIQPPMVEEYKKRVYYAYDRVNQIPNMSAITPQGTLYVFVNIKATGLSSVEVSKQMLEQAHVKVVPGSAFGQGGEGYLRISCTVTMDELTQAFGRIEKMSIFQN
jgi:aspartate/methionine/tyrosine aminotransferase